MMDSLTAQIRWRSGDSTPVRVVSWDATQTTVRFELAGMSCLQHFATATGLPLQGDGTPESQPEVWLEFTDHNPFQS